MLKMRGSLADTVCKKTADEAKCSADYVGFPALRHQLRLCHLAANRHFSRGVEAEKANGREARPST
jgi:hypothetical protein